MNQYRPITFDCGDGVKIHLCPELVQSTATHTEFWYIYKDLRSWDDMDLWRSGFRTLYWTDQGWRHHTPIKFQTSGEAIEYHRNNEEKINL